MQVEVVLTGRCGSWNSFKSPDVDGHNVHINKSHQKNSIQIEQPRVAFGTCVAGMERSYWHPANWPVSLVATSPASLNWVRQAEAASGVTPTQSGALNASERQELIELRRKLRQVQLERDILAKATAWFAHNGDKTFTPSTR